MTGGPTTRNEHRVGWSSPVRRDGAWAFTNADITKAATVGDVPAAAMGYPVRCHCGLVYDLATAEHVASVGAVNVWRTPCCERQADDREAQRVPAGDRTPQRPGWRDARDYRR